MFLISFLAIQSSLFAKNPLSRKSPEVIKESIIPNTVVLIDRDFPKLSKKCIYKAKYKSNKDDKIRLYYTVCPKIRRKNISESPTKYYCKKASKSSYQECADKEQEGYLKALTNEYLKLKNHPVIEAPKPKNK